MATKKQVARSRGTKKPAAAPAAALSQAKATIDEASKVDPPRVATGRHPASIAAEVAGKARRELGTLAVPMTLSEITTVIGVDCRAEHFAVTALDCLATQLQAMVAIAGKEEVDPYNAYVVMDSIVERMKLASRVTAWLESDVALASLPEVAP